ncbi:MAG: T9SS type A sorting domain-containing protein, partial [candidate division WOR-3 bacterium]
IAPFWDDLDPSEAGDLYQYYDSEGHRWIIEFYQVDHWGGPGNYETFQVILYDPLYYPTPTGDGEIVVQYLVQMQESYSTLGIEDHTETVGIQYYFNGIYHELAVPVTDSFALKYTTSPPSTGIEEQEELTTVPARTTLSVPYPNPFTREMSLSYQVATMSRVDVKVYDVSGRLVRCLAHGVHNPGYHTLVWDGRDDIGRALSAGIYFVRFETTNYEQIEKAI